MANSFHLIDLRSQGAEVRRHLEGKTLQQKVEWISGHGKLTVKPVQPNDAHVIYWFESREGLHSTFFFVGDDLVIVHEHSIQVFRHKTTEEER